MGGKPKPEQPSQSEQKADEFRNKYIGEIIDDKPVAPHDFSRKPSGSFADYMGGGNRVASGGAYSGQSGPRPAVVAKKPYSAPSMGNERLLMYDKFQGRR